MRWVKTLDEEVPQVIEGNEKLNKPSHDAAHMVLLIGYSVGACVTIVSGPHAGLLGKVEYKCLVN